MVINAAHSRNFFFIIEKYLADMKEMELGKSTRKKTREWVISAALRDRQ